MLTFTVSKTLSEAMGLNPATPSGAVDPELHWWAHWVPVQDQHFVLLMHEPTRYCMVFFEPDSSGKQEFFSLFSERLPREVHAVCQPLPKVSERLRSSMARACKTHQFRISLDYAASADLFDAARALQTLLEKLGKFPVPGMTEFSLGIKVNQLLGSQQQNNPQNRLDQFRQFWLDLSARELSATGQPR